MIATDGAGRVTYWNRAAEELYGWTADEALGNDVTALTVPEPGQVDAAEIMRKLLRGEPWSGEFVTARKDGTLRTVQVTDVPMVDRAGRVAGVIGASVDVSERVEQQERLQQSEALYRQVFLEGISAVAAMFAFRDPYTAGHQEATARVAAAICERMALDASTSEGIFIAATIHDIGKIATPAEILVKPTSLTPEERALVQQHARIGHDIAANVTQLWPVARMILEHHERMDGSGYPQGLRGPDILLGSRIIAVADVFDAMTAHRPYRPVMPIEQVVAFLRDAAPRLLDAEVVATCLALVDEGLVGAGTHDRLGGQGSVSDDTIEHSGAAYVVNTVGSVTSTISGQRRPGC
jgi:PAS domain S-box-containing protein